MKIRNVVVYLLAFLITLTFSGSIMAEDPPPGPGTEPTTLVLDIEPDQPTTKSSFTVSAELYQNDTALEGYDIELSYGKDENGDGALGNEEEEVQVTKNTDANGHVEYTFTAPNKAGDYDYQAYFEGSGDYDYENKMKAFTVVKTPTVLEVRIKPAPKADTINHPACGYCDRQPLDKSSRFRPDGQSYTFIHTPYRIRGWF